TGRDRVRVQVGGSLAELTGLVRTKRDHRSVGQEGDARLVAGSDVDYVAQPVDEAGGYHRISGRPAELAGLIHAPAPHIARAIEGEDVAIADGDAADGV